MIGLNCGDMDPGAVKARHKDSPDDLGKPGRDASSGSGRLNVGNLVPWIQHL